MKYIKMYITMTSFINAHAHRLELSILTYNANQKQELKII